MSRCTGFAVRQPYMWRPDYDERSRPATPADRFLCDALALSPRFLERCIPELGLLLEELHGKCVSLWDKDVKFVRVQYSWTRSTDQISVAVSPWIPCACEGEVIAYAGNTSTMNECRSDEIRMSVSVPRGEGYEWKSSAVKAFAEYLMEPAASLRAALRTVVHECKSKLNNRE